VFHEAFDVRADAGGQAAAGGVQPTRGRAQPYGRVQILASSEGGRHARRHRIARPVGIHRFDRRARHREEPPTEQSQGRGCRPGDDYMLRAGLDQVPGGVHEAPKVVPVCAAVGQQFLVTHLEHGHAAGQGHIQRLACQVGHNGLAVGPDVRRQAPIGVGRQ